MLKFRWIKISPLFLIAWFMFAAFGGVGYTLCLLASAAVHEAAHMLALKSCGKRIRELLLLPFGIRLEFEDKGFLSYRQEAAVALAGPAANLFACVLALAAKRLLGGGTVAAFAVMANAALFLFNMLPIVPLDGARALNCVLLTKIEPETADKISFWVSLILLVPVISAGAYVLAATGYNFSLITAGLYMLCSALFGWNR